MVCLVLLIYFSLCKCLNCVQRCLTSTTTSKTTKMINPSPTIRVIVQVKDKMLTIIKSNFLEQNLQMITIFIQLVQKFLFLMQVSNMLNLKIPELNIFLTIILFQIHSCIIIDHQPHQTLGINLEHVWISQGRTRSTKGYRVKQQNYFHQPTEYSDFQ